MAVYLMGIVGAIVLTTLIDVIIAEGETKKFVKGVASVLVIAAIIAPLPALFNGGLELNWNNQTSVNQNIQNEGYLNRVYMERYKQHELDCQQLLKNAGIEGAVVRININIHNLQVEVINVTVDIKNANVAKDVDERETIVRVIRNALRVDESRIIIIS
jgi:hypothetical protein